MGAGLDTVHVWPVPPGAAPLRITLEEGRPGVEGSGFPAHPRQDAIDRAWEDLCRENPRFFDGPVLGVERYDEPGNHVLCRRDSFKRFAVQGRVPTGLYQIGVQGLVTALDDSGAEHVLLGRRGAQTRIYQGMWEHAPAGGCPPPREVLTGDVPFTHVLRSLAEEAEEELGFTLPLHSARVAAIIRDDLACCYDLSVRIRLDDPIDPRRAPCCAAGEWEYLDTAWAPVAQLADFDRSGAESIIPPTRALWRTLGWVPGP